MRVFALAVILCGVLSGAAQAAIPLQVNYQGRVAVGGAPFNGNGLFRFTLADRDSSTTLWCNDGSQNGNPAGTTPTAAVNLPVINGIFNVRLGDTAFANMLVLPSTVFDGDRVALRVWFNDQSNGNARLSPDQPITSVAYAYHAAKADTADTATTASYALLSATSESGFEVLGHNFTFLTGTTSATSATDLSTTDKVDFTLSSDTDILILFRVTMDNSGNNFSYASLHDDSTTPPVDLYLHSVIEHVGVNNASKMGLYYGAFSAGNHSLHLRYYVTGGTGRFWRRWLVVIRVN